MGKTKDYYDSHPEAKKKKLDYAKKYNKKSEQVEKRCELIKINREHDKKHGKASRAGKDASHTKNGIVYKDKSTNRGSKSDTAGDKRARG